MSTAVYSGGLDGTVRSWRLPSASNGLGLIDIYAPQELETVTGPVFASELFISKYVSLVKNIL